MTSRCPRCTPSKVPTVITVSLTDGGSPDCNDSPRDSAIFRDHSQSPQRRVRCANVVHRDGVANTERSTSRAPQRGEMRGAACQAAEIARERPNVGAGAAGDLDIEL